MSSQRLQTQLTRANLTRTLGAVRAPPPEPIPRPLQAQTVGGLDLLFPVGECGPSLPGQGGCGPRPQRPGVPLAPQRRSCPGETSDPEPRPTTQKGRNSFTPWPELANWWNSFILNVTPVSTQEMWSKLGYTGTRTPPTQPFTVLRRGGVLSSTSQREDECPLRTGLKNKRIHKNNSTSLIDLSIAESFRHVCQLSCPELRFHDKWGHPTGQ